METTDFLILKSQFLIIKAQHNIYLSYIDQNKTNMTKLTLQRQINQNTTYHYQAN